MKLSFEYLLPAAGHEAGRELYSLQMITLLSYKVLSINGGPASSVSQSQAWGRVLVYRLQPPARSHHHSA